MTSPYENDDQEVIEWQQALRAVVKHRGADFAQQLVTELCNEVGASAGGGRSISSFVNTFSANETLPEDADTIQHVIDATVWNAVATVIKAGRRAKELGGHLATFASAAALYIVGLSYYFKARNDDQLGDLVFFQGHASPGIYAHAFLQGRLTEKQLLNFRQEVGGEGIPSYPHPWLMPDFWQFATVSMGIGPMFAIYQAKFLRYLHNRGLVNNEGRRVWAFCGDGELDEPESLGALRVAARDNLDNLVFVVNNNLQRLDGLVNGNHLSIQKFEGVFSGAGWHVIKLIWNSQWDQLFEQDTEGLLLKRFEKMVDGDLQNYQIRGVDYIREHFFGDSPELAELIADWSDEELAKLNPGGHDLTKIYNAYKQAVEHKGSPVVLLVRTIKGYGLGEELSATNATHQTKTMTDKALLNFVKKADLPLSDKQATALDFYQFDKGSKPAKFLAESRERVGGDLPKRFSDCPKLKVPKLTQFKALLEGMGDRQISTTMAFVRILNILIRDKDIRQHIVPIVADEARTFGMEGLFKQIGIYTADDQKYEPYDKSQLMSYHESKDGQLLEEGINEAGAFSSWAAAATSYSVNGLPMIPFYTYYSMFGFQRIGDFVWAAADMRSRGFLMGATAGRTTLAGEGLQHTDGHNLIMFDVVPNCRAYDPAFAYELAVIVQQGMTEMYVEQNDVFYYITLMNENYQQPAMPKGVEQGILKGMYCYRSDTKQSKHQVQLLGSGTILNEVIAAAELLKQLDVGADIWSVTSYSELRREALTVQRSNRLNSKAKPKTSYVKQCLADQPGPVIAATDYMRLQGDMIREFLDQRYYVLGTDGFGRSDTRVALRHHFEVDAKHIAFMAIRALVDDGGLAESYLSKAIKLFEIDVEKIDPMSA